MFVDRTCNNDELVNAVAGLSKAIVLSKEQWIIVGLLDRWWDKFELDSLLIGRLQLSVSDF